MSDEIIMVTGGDGKIARAIVERYLSNNNKVIVIDRKEKTDKNAPFWRRPSNPEEIF